MAFDIKEHGGYLDGELGDLSVADGATQDINSYVKVTKITDNVIEIALDTMIEGKYVTFRAGTQIFLHVSSSNRETADYLGLYTFANITLVNNNTLTLDKNVGAIFDGVNLDYESVQAVAVVNFDCVHLEKGGILTPPPFNPYDFVGGLLVIKCWNTFEFNGGNIDLTDCGIPYNRKNALRPLHFQETAAQGQNDKAKLAGQENFITAERFLLNAGDGAAFIVAKKIVCNDDSRIGNPATHGAAYCRGAVDSVGVKPSNITNLGGSTILLAADTIENFTPKLIAKYRSADKPEGKGLCRCYIASNTKLRTDEGLYAYDTISTPARVRELGIEDFGTGNFGDYVNPTAPFNNYAKVTSISQNGYRFKVAGKTLSGIVPLRLNSLVMALITQKTDKYTNDAGKFVVGRVVGLKNDSVTLDRNLNVDLNKYNAQLISIPEFNTLTINQNYAATPKYSNGIGGVCAVAVADTFNLEGGKINVENKGGGTGYGRAGLATIGNAQDSDKLPLGEGHGSVFILAKNLTLNENSRIGATYSGDNPAGGNNFDGTNRGGGYSGAEDENQQGSGGGFVGGGSFKGNAGSGAYGGTSTLGEYDASKEVGGYGSKGKGDGGGLQGAHLFIIADKVTGLTTANISTGGGAAKGAVAGSASQGGGGSPYGNGGSGAFAFIYCNEAV